MNLPTHTSKQLKMITLTAVFAALIFLATAYLPRIPFPGGYVHIGDAFLYLTAALLPTPYACAAGAIGAGLADALTGYMIYAPGTVIIKILTALLFSSKHKNILSPRNLIAVVPSAAICVGGYYLYEVLLTGSFYGPVTSIPFNLSQALASAVIFILIGFFLDRASLKSKLFK